jgi:hypothetical protein
MYHLLQNCLLASFRKIILCEKHGPKEIYLQTLGITILLHHPRDFFQSCLIIKHPNFKLVPLVVNILVMINTY